MGYILTLGESLLRLSTEEGRRLSHASSLFVEIGGAEGNVAMNLAQLGHAVRYATKIPNNTLGERVLHQLGNANVDTSAVLKGEGRLGLYYLEPGRSIRAGKVLYDRAYSTMASMTEWEWDDEQLFQDVSLVHISGITLALSPAWRTLGLQFIQKASQRGIPISFDMNYRATMWSLEEAKTTYQAVLPYISYLSATPKDATCFMDLLEINECDYQVSIQKIAAAYPQLKKIYGTKRVLQSANSYALSGYLYCCDTHCYHESDVFMLASIIDRVGTGDSYAAGILDGIISEASDQDTVQFATAASALKHTIFGDVNLFSRTEILQFSQQKNNIIR